MVDRKYDNCLKLIILYKKILINFFIAVCFNLLIPSQIKANTIIFEDDFNDGTIDDRWTIRNYAAEEEGSFSSVSELGITEENGTLKFSGTATLDTVTLDNNTSVGNIGKSVTINQVTPRDTDVAIETDLEIISGSNFSSAIIIDFDPDNRIKFGITSAGHANLVIDENNTTSNNTYPFIVNFFQKYKLKLNYNTTANLIDAYIDEQHLFSMTFFGNTNDYRVGLASTLRFPGDTLDARFDNFKLYTSEDFLNENEVPYLSQSDEDWGDDEYDHANDWDPPVSNTSISRWGCAMTSANMLLQYHNVSDVLPGDLNDWLKDQDDGFTRSGGVIWNTIGRYSRDQDPESSTLEFQYLSDDPTDENIKNEINDGIPPILKLDNVYGGNHFIVATGVDDNGSILVNDPGNSDNETLEDAEEFWGEAEQIGRYTLSNTDLSYIIQYIDDGLDIELSSASGILAKSFDEDPLLNAQDREELSGEPLNTLYYAKPESGNYTATITGEVGLYQLDNYLFDVSGDSNQSTDLGFIAYEGEQDNYEIMFDHDENTNSEIQSPETTYESLLIDLEAINDLGMIKNRGIYRSTHQLITNAEKLRHKNRAVPEKILLTVALERIKMSTPEYIDEDHSSYFQQEINNLLEEL